MAVPDLRGNPKKRCMAAGSLFSKCPRLTVYIKHRKSVNPHRRHNKQTYDTTTQQYNHHNAQDDTTHDTCITHAQHSAPTPTLNLLLTPHIQLEYMYSVKHRSFRHHRAEHYALRHALGGAEILCRNLGSFFHLFRANFGPGPADLGNISSYLEPRLASFSSHCL
jgi:hypothetical protein